MFRLCAPHWWCALATAALAVARPPPLAPRNAVTACVSPASPVAYLDSFVSRDAFARHAQRNALGVGGWHATFGAHAFDATDYLAGTDAQRASDFNKALTNDSVRAVVATRGGYGCARLLPLLDCAAFARAPKPVVGYSDMTACLLALYARTGVYTYHAAMMLDNWTQPTTRARSSVTSPTNSYCRSVRGSR